VVRREDGSLLGHNTDYFGFRSLVERTGLSVDGKKALVLGSGGASNTAVAVLEEMGARVVVISRTGEDNYGNLERHADAAILVNTTPVGMYPNTGASPVALEQFPLLEGVLDVVYNPAKTRLLLDAESRGIVAMNGLWMLVAQAKRASEHFTGCSIDDASIEKIHSLLQKQTENDILENILAAVKSPAVT
jgi:shikimate dehydrogenase